jgi:hypothetical protein
MSWRLKVCLAALAGLALLMPASPNILAATPAAEMVPLTKGQVLRGRFEQTRELKGFDAPLKSNGNFVVAPGRGLIWRTVTPFAVATIMSASGLLQEVNGQEAMRVPANKLPFVTKLYEMLGGALSGDLKALSNVFEITRKDDAKGWRLVMSPLRADDINMPMKSITVRGQKFVEEVLMTKTNGDVERLVLLDQKLTASDLQSDETVLLDKAGKL